MKQHNIEHPTLLDRHMRQFLHQHSLQGVCHPPFTCEVLIVLGGNIVKTGDGYMTTPYKEGVNVKRTVSRTLLQN